MHGWGGHGRHQQHRREVSATLGGLGRLRGGAWPLVGRQFAHTARNANTSRQAIGYVRVSTEQQADSGLSIAVQRVKLEALAVLNDYQLIDVVVDAGASAKSLDRPGWQRVMGAVHGRQVGAVLIAKLDRCTRSVADLASLIDTFSRRGVALISAAESLDTSSAGGRLVVNVLGAVAQWEREATAERTSAALQVLKAQGRATGGVAPYGFQFIDGRRAWHQGEQETLAAIIEHRAAGLSWAKVADKLSATGHRTRTGGQWTRQGAHQVHQAREREHGAAA